MYTELSASSNSIRTMHFTADPLWHTNATTPPSPLSLNSVTVYIVQNCWLDGPKMDPPMDCMTVFTTKYAAEKTACYGAHSLWSQQASDPNKPVRTLLLSASGVLTAASDTFASSRDSSFAFTASGRLFWVRSVQALQVQCCVGGGNNPSHCFVLMNHNVIGGSSNNAHARRGTEQTKDCVIVECGCGRSVAWQLARQYQLQCQTERVERVPLAMATVPWNGGTMVHTTTTTATTATTAMPLSDMSMTMTTDENAPNAVKRSVTYMETKGWEFLGGLVTPEQQPWTNDVRPTKRQCMGMELSE